LEENFAHAALVTAGGQNVAPPFIGAARAELWLVSANHNHTNPIATAQDAEKRSSRSAKTDCLMPINPSEYGFGRLLQEWVSLVE
jgi:hypothetical protein